MPLNHLLRKYTEDNKLLKSQEKINHLMYMDDIKVIVKKDKDVETLIQTIRIHRYITGIEFGIGKCAILIKECGAKGSAEEKEQLN